MSIFNDPSVVINSKYKTNRRGLVFPLDLIDMSADRNFYVSIRFKKYERRSIFNRIFERDEGGICLPMPTRIVDSQGVTWSATATNPIIGAGLEAFIGGGEGKRGDVGSVAAAAGMAGVVQLAAGAGAITGAIGGGAIGGLYGALTSASRAAGAAAGAASGSAAGSQIGSIVDQAFPQVLQINGVAQNPFMTVLFKQPEYKTHQFSWTLTPRNAKESDVVRDIVQTLKSNMLPAFTPGSAGVLMTYPNIAEINLFPSDKFLYKFKPCALTKFSVNYAGGGGQPSFFKGTKAPTVVEIATEWQEIEYWMKEDVEDPDGKSWAAAAREANPGALFK